MFVESLPRVLADDDRIEVVGVAATAAEGLALAGERRPRVAIVDYGLRTRTGWSWPPP